MAWYRGKSGGGTVNSAPMLVFGSARGQNNSQNQYSFIYVDPTDISSYSTSIFWTTGKTYSIAGKFSATTGTNTNIRITPEVDCTLIYKDNGVYTTKQLSANVQETCACYGDFWTIIFN